MERDTKIPSREEIRDILELRHGKEIQQKLSDARVAVAGLGGLGSNVAVQLARTGVGHLHLIDYDCVDLSNLNRQHYFIRHLGKPKTDALREQLLEIHPYLDIRTDTVKVTQDNVAELFTEDEIICEAFDVPENRRCWSTGSWNIFRKNIWCAAAEWQDSGTAMRYIPERL